jgi:hypothetical protein
MLKIMTSVYFYCETKLHNKSELKQAKTVVLWFKQRLGILIMIKCRCGGLSYKIGKTQRIRQIHKIIQGFRW